MRAADVTIEWPRGETGARMLKITTEGTAGVLSTTLLPVEVLYSSVMAARNLAYDSGVLRSHRVSMPVISIGNIVAGGAGKTPLTRWLAEQLLARGRRPAVLHGGYGADEPRLHREWHPEIIVVSERDRVAGAKHAIAQGADVILLDDGFQHRRLARDCDVVLLPADDTALRLLPRGPGREPMRAIRRSNFVVVTRKAASSDEAMRLETQAHQMAPDVPTGRVHLRLAGAVPDAPIVVATAIARPDLLLAQLLQANADVKTFLAYPDHHDYSADDVALIRTRAGNHLLVTTAKDAVKLRELMPEQPMHVLEQELVFESGAGELMSVVDNVL